MTVNELINFLHIYNGDTEVCLSQSEIGYMPITAHGNFSTYKFIDDSEHVSASDGLIYFYKGKIHIDC